MIKRFFLALALMTGLLSPAYSAGTISLSLTQQLDNATQKPLAGGKLYFFQAGTTTPQIAYQDTALTIPLPGGSIYTLDSNGRIPQFFLADGQIKIRLDNSIGVTQLAADNLLVIGPSGGGGGGSSVDPTTILTTGDIKTSYGTGVLSGFVRANGRTIGSATSGATERANADAQALFQYLWGADANLAVSGGRGASAAADWAANKTIALPDARSRALAGLGDMGNVDNGVLSSASFTTGNALTLGSTVGAARRTLALANVPAGITSSNPSQAISVTSSLSSYASGFTSGAVLTNGSGSWFGAGALTQMTIGSIFSSANNSISVTSNNTSGSAFDTVSPYMVVTIYIKL